MDPQVELRSEIALALETMRREVLCSSHKHSQWTALISLRSERREFENALGHDLLRGILLGTSQDLPHALQSEIRGHRDFAFGHVKRMILGTFDVLCQAFQAEEDPTKVRATEDFVLLKLRLRDRFANYIVNMQDRIADETARIQQKASKQAPPSDRTRSSILRAAFEQNPYPSSTKIRQLSERCGVSKESIDVWFSRKRAELRRLPLKKRHTSRPSARLSKRKAWKEALEFSESKRVGVETNSAISNSSSSFKVQPDSQAEISATARSADDCSSEPLLDLLKSDAMQEICKEQTLLHTRDSPGIFLTLPRQSLSPFALTGDIFWRLLSNRSPSRSNSHELGLESQEWSSFLGYTTESPVQRDPAISPYDPFATLWNLTPREATRSATPSRLRFQFP